MSKKEVVRYLAPRNSGEKEFKFVSIVVEGKNVKRYFNTLGVLSKLSKGERLLLDYILEVMDSNNYITNNQQFRNNFNQLMIRFKQKPYTTATIHKNFSNIQKKCILDQKKGRGVYQVSPSFFFKGSQKDRKTCIRKLLEEEFIDPINRIRRGYFVHRKV